MNFVQQVYQDRADRDALLATLEQVRMDPGFHRLSTEVREAVESFFEEQSE